MKKQLRVLAVGTILLFASAAIFAQKPMRVSFYKGATTAIVSGNLRNYKDKKVFVIRVRRNQTLNTEQINSENSARYISVSIKSPSGEDATDSDASCNNRKEVAPTAAGDYTITVYECGKADAWRGRFKLKITVK